MHKFPIGSRIKVGPTAGPRLAGKIGSVVGLAHHPTSRRIVLDGSRCPITLHITYLAILDEAPGSDGDKQTWVGPVCTENLSSGVVVVKSAKNDV